MELFVKPYVFVWILHNQFVHRTIVLDLVHYLYTGNKDLLLISLTRLHQ